ncbi:hypothetical protein ACN47E_002309 [Coniothyrium glycines]
MSKRKATNDEWDERKAEIGELFFGDTGTLPEVMLLMEQRSFKRTKAQYETAFKSWGFRKNLNKVEQEYIQSELRCRTAEGKQSVVKFRGAKIAQSRLEKLRRRDFVTTFEAYAMKNRRPENPPTPPGIFIASPSPPPSTARVEWPTPAVPASTTEHPPNISNQSQSNFCAFRKADTIVHFRSWIAGLRPF